MITFHEKPWYQILVAAIGLFVLFLAAITAIVGLFDLIVRILK